MARRLGDHVIECFSLENPLGVREFTRDIVASSGSLAWVTFKDVTWSNKMTKIYPQCILESSVYGERENVFSESYQGRGSLVISRVLFCPGDVPRYSLAHSTSELVTQQG